MKIKLLYVIIIAVSFFFFNCESSNIRFDDAGVFLKDTSGNPTVDTVYFTTQVLPVFQNNCSSCHHFGTDPDFQSPEIYNILINGHYLNVADPENSNLFYLPDPGHADDYLTAAEHVLIVKWIEQGALEN